MDLPSEYVKATHKDAAILRTGLPMVCLDNDYSGVIVLARPTGLLVMCDDGAEEFCFLSQAYVSKRGSAFDTITNQIRDPYYSTRETLRAALTQLKAAAAIWSIPEGEKGEAAELLEQVESAMHHCDTLSNAFCAAHPTGGVA